MNRHVLPILFAALGLAFGGCSKVKLPFISKKSAQATPAPAAVVTPAPAATPAPAPAKETVKVDEADAAASLTKGDAIVLCYHRFEERPRAGDSLAIKPSEFEEQMQALKEHGFTVIGMQDFLAWRRGEKAIPDKACVISIDDGYRSGYEKAWPILKKFGYPFTMFIYTNYVKGQPNAGGQSLSWGELAEMRDAGVDIQSHTVSHLDLRAQTGKKPSYEEWLHHELEGSKHMLEQQLGISVKALAYPFGNHNEKVRTAALAAGYEVCFTVYGQRITYHSSPAQLGRYAIDSVKPQVFQAALKMMGGGGGGDDESATGRLAAASMVTQPMEGETITDPQPTLKANLAALGDVDPKSVEVRLSGIGQLPAKYDPATKTVEAPVTEKLHDKNYTVILSAKVKGRKVETRWTFNFAPNGESASTPAASEAATAPAGTTPPAAGTKSRR